MIRPLQKERLRDKAADELLRLIVSARLGPGTILSSVDLARQMGISRTPVREALQRLEKDGFVVADAGGIFKVAELSREEASNIYQLRGELEPLALQMAGLPTTERVDELAGINARLKTASRASELIRLDEQWHLALLRHCPNPFLLGYVENLHRLSRRYEYAYMCRGEECTPSLDQHGEILAALRDRDLPSACRYLQSNMLVGLPAILQWLDDDD